MRSYWLKIMVGAVIIFTVGFVGVKLVKSGSATVRNVVSGTGPITIPLPAFVPFNLDGNRLGSVRHLIFYRTATQKPSHIGVEIQIPDSVTSDRLRQCVLLVESLDNVDEHTTFRCADARDTAGKSFLPFGTVTIRDRSDSFPLLLPETAVRDLTEHGSSSGRRSAGSRQRADSIRSAVQARVDSALQRAGQDRTAARDAADSAVKTARSR